MDTKCTSKANKKILHFCKVKKKNVYVNFGGGEVTSDAGCLLLSKIEQKIKLLSDVVKVLPDDRDQSKTVHKMLSMLTQRVFGLALGYEDLNDHTTLRSDTAFQASVNEDKKLASASTLCRFENKANKKIAFEINKIFVDKFIESYEKPPNELILDFDATDDIVHGNQEGKSYHGYYRNYCFLPLYVFCGKQLLTAYLRPANKDGAMHAGAILRLLVTRLRQKWPHVKIIFRGDCGFYRHTVFYWCEQNNVDYIVGAPSNNVLKNKLKPSMEQAANDFEKTKIKQRVFSEFSYQAKSWGNERKIIGKAEHTSKGENPRFIITNIEQKSPQELYEKMYCGRGRMENCIKEIQLGLFSDRTSCHVWWSNFFRMLLSAMGYILIERMSAIALTDSNLNSAQVETIRLKLFKIGAVIVKNTRRILIMLSSSYPYQELFWHVYKKLVPS